MSSSSVVATTSNQIPGAGIGGSGTNLNQLILASRMGSMDDLHRLLNDLFKQPNLVTESILDQPLLEAIQHGQIEAARVLIEESAILHHPQTTAPVTTSATAAAAVSDSSNSSDCRAGSRINSLTVATGWVFLRCEWELLQLLYDSGVREIVSYEPILNGVGVDEDRRYATLSKAFHLWPPTSTDISVLYALSVDLNRHMCYELLVRKQEEEEGQKFSKRTLRTMAEEILRESKTTNDMRTTLERMIQEASDGDDHP